MNAGHHHTLPAAPPSAQRVYLIALVLTLTYAMVEAVGGVWAGSLALVSDSGHMLSDGLALALAAAAAHLAQRPASARHSYGWARAEVVGALINGLLMLGIVVWLVVEAVHRLLDPRPVAAAGVLIIAFIGLVVNALVAYVLSRSEESLNQRAALLHVLGDLLSSIAALIAGAVVYFTGWVSIDPILSLVIGGLILFSTLNLLRETLHVLMEGVPAALNLPAIGEDLATIPGVARVHDLHVWTIGSNRIALSAHLEVAGLGEWPQILHASRALLHDRYDIDHVTLQPEEHQPQGHRATVKLWPSKPVRR